MQSGAEPQLSSLYRRPLTKLTVTLKLIMAMSLQKKQIGTANYDEYLNFSMDELELNLI